jgi:sterol desaturase/sphingolipid hydroxylase (fatty acid hydroxylase superfamily)
VLSVGVMVLMHDAYFCWTYRLMHSHPRLFRLSHRTHHLWAGAAPWAACTFGVPEAFVQAGIGPLIVFTVHTSWATAATRSSRAGSCAAGLGAC